MHVPLIVIGGGLSGLAAAIRFARFIPDVLLLEKHSRLGGLNSYYYRNKTLLETGLHAVTNYAAPKDKKAPLNRLLRQLKLNRSRLEIHQQLTSEIHFAGVETLSFSNDFNLLQEQINQKFPGACNGFGDLVGLIESHDPFAPAPFQSARKVLTEKLGDELLIDMLLCPLMYYGSSVANDMDFSQFVIMFRAIFQEGMFRPRGTIKDLLDMLKAHYLSFGGEIRLNSQVKKIMAENSRITGVELADGEVITCDALISTVGHQESLALLGLPEIEEQTPRLGFVESIFQVKPENLSLPSDKTIIFFNSGKRFSYERPEQIVDFNSGVICFPDNFVDSATRDHLEVRSTHLANYHLWKKAADKRENYLAEKEKTARLSLAAIEKIIGNFKDNIVYNDTFTPLTIERFTAKREGAIYGCATKIKNGDIGLDNMFLAGTDQGFLGIVGSMLSGVSMVNQHILPRL
ncbi:MAG: NAD(P)/FAD-dependent oxidoreductase [Thermodesulfobacteriota bacterium]